MSGGRRARISKGVMDPIGVMAPVLAHHVEEVELSRRLVTKDEAESRRRDFERLLAEYRKNV